jgi:hypothetical protein
MSLEQYKDATRKELWEILQIQVERIAELGSNILMLEQYNGSVDSLIKGIKAHNLEQQAKGVEDAANDSSDNLDATMVYLADLDDRAIELRNQAKALKEKGNE